MSTNAHVETDKAQKKPHKVDKVILDLFWTLAEGSDGDRVRAAERLCQRLVESKSKDPEAALSEQKYCLQRLIRGLSSNRKFARVGYAVALTKVLRQMKAIKVKDVLAAVTEELKVSAHDPKSEVGNKLLGRVFAYGALVQSERKLKAEHMSSLVSELLSLGEKKSYIRPTCTQTLLDLIERVTAEELREAVRPSLQKDQDKGWEDCTPDRLLLLLACRKKDKSQVDKAYLQSHWGASKLLGKDNHEHMLHLLMRSVEAPQLLPVLLGAVAKEVTSKAVEATEFWTKVGNPLLASTVPRKQVAVSLFCQLAEHAQDLNLVQAMLFPGVASVLCKTADKKDEQLTEVCAKAESLLVKLCKGDAEVEVKLAIIKGFLKTCLRLKCDSFMRGTTLSSLVGSLQGQAAEEFTQICVDCVLGRAELLSEVEEKEVDKFCQQLVPLIRVTALSPTAQQSGSTGRTLKFLFLHTFFKVFKSTKDIPHCEEVSPNLSPTLRSMCQATFYRMLTQLLSTRTERGSQSDHVLNYIKVLTDLAQYAQKLLGSSNNVQPVKDISDEVREEWSSIMDVVTPKKGQKRKSAGSSSVGETEAFTLLILHLAFDLFKEPESTIELLQDIYICREKAAKKQKSKSSDGEPHWVEVITEVLLSMLSRASKLARKTTAAVFSSLSPHLTPAALMLVTEVVKSDKSKKEGDLFEFEDMEVDIQKNDDDDDDEEQEDDNEDDEDEEMAVDDESEESDEEDDDEEEVDEEFRRSVKTALGPAAVDSDKEDEEQEDLSDSEMFKLDEQLAAVFRSMKRPTKKEKKEKRREVGNFRLRALDLLEVIVKGERCGDFAIELLESLSKLVQQKFKSSQSQPSGLQQLCNRATDLFHILCKQRNLTDHIHTQEEMLETTTSLLQLAHTGSNPQVAAEMANGCLCIMRLMSPKPDAEPSPVKTRAMKSNGHAPSHDGQAAFVHAIQAVLEENLVERKNSRYSMAFFIAMIHKYPSVFWPLTDTVLMSLKSPDTKVHTKTQACSLLVQLVRLNKRDNLTEDQWTSFFTSVSTVLRQLVLSQQMEEMKKGLMQEVLTALFHLTHMISVEERKEVLTDALLAHLALLKGAFNKDTRKMHNRLTQLLAQSNSKKAKKRKRQASESEAPNGRMDSP